VHKSDFRYELPATLIAQQPLATRSASRLLFLDGASGERRDLQFADLPSLLRPGDLLVFNDTRVVPARLYGTKETGGRVELLVERMLGGRQILVQMRASKPPKTGHALALDGGAVAHVVGRQGGFYRLEIEGDEPIPELLDRIGHVPLPPYIERSDTSSDRSRYQTVYARDPGAVAAPTAGLHFDEPLLARLKEIGLEFGYVTLHVGAGTFQPLRTEKIDEHRMHPEWLRVEATVAEQVNRARREGRRVVAVGTTVVRALESTSRDGQVVPFEGDTDIFITPGYRFRQIDALITNFHLPESTLLMLVCAFAGTEQVLAAYRHAVSRQYRFYSYGDAMFVLPVPAASAKMCAGN
jgi:S-adenosylmethionine:tRNA ribosyltransferase-isomerase